MDIPIRFLPTQTLAPETFLIRQLGGEGSPAAPLVSQTDFEALIQILAATPAEADAAGAPAHAA